MSATVPHILGVVALLRHNTSACEEQDGATFKEHCFTMPLHYAVLTSTQVGMQLLRRVEAAFAGLQYHVVEV